MPEFVILRHEMPPSHARSSHLDLMLEQSGVLRTWALPELPTSKETILANQLPDHRLAYLEFEGEISGNRGSVTRVDSGQYEVVEETQSALTVRLNGQKLQGTLTLTRDIASSQRWRVDFSPG